MTTFEGLPEAEPTTEDPRPEQDAPSLSGPACAGCGFVIERPPGKRGRMPKYHDACRPKTTSKPRRKTAKASGGQYVEGITSLFQMAATGVVVGANGRPELYADADALIEHGPNIASALDALANERPEVAAVLDRIMAVGPYGALVAAFIPLIAQILTNHKVLPPGILGSHSSPLIEEAEKAAHAAG